MLKNILLNALLGLGFIASGLAQTSPDTPQLSPERRSRLDTGQIIDNKLARLAASIDRAEASRLAEDILSSWRDAGGATIDVLMKRGLELVEYGHIALARDMFDRVVLIEPGFAEGWNQRAEIFMRDELYAEAAADLENTIRLEPRHFGAWQRLGQMFEALGENEAALKAYRRTLRLHPFAAQARAGEARLVPVVEGRAL